MTPEGYKIFCDLLLDIPEIDGIEGIEVPPEPQTGEDVSEFEITIHYEPEIITQDTKSELLLKELGHKGLMYNSKPRHFNPHAPSLKCISFGVQWDAPGEVIVARTLGFRDTKAAQDETGARLP